jgi:DNA-directed RNA polymerase specialized sigma24 family protein
MKRESARDSAAAGEVLGSILAEIVDRRRAGAAPTAGEYAARYPAFAEAIGKHLDLIEYLESARGAWRGAHADESLVDHPLPPVSLAAAIAELPEPSQRVIFLRHFERLPWREIAERLGESEKTLRTRHAAALRALIERCRSWFDRET